MSNLNNDVSQGPIIDVGYVACDPMIPAYKLATGRKKCGQRL